MWRTSCDAAVSASPAAALMQAPCSLNALVWGVMRRDGSSAALLLGVSDPGTADALRVGHRRLHSRTLTVALIVALALTLFHASILRPHPTIPHPHPYATPYIRPPHPTTTLLSFTPPQSQAADRLTHALFGMATAVLWLTLLALWRRRAAIRMQDGRTDRSIDRSTGRWM